MEHWKVHEQDTDDNVLDGNPLYRLLMPNSILSYEERWNKTFLTILKNTSYIKEFLFHEFLSKYHFSDGGVEQGNLKMEFEVHNSVHSKMLD